MFKLYPNAASDFNCINNQLNKGPVDVIPLIEFRVIGFIKTLGFRCCLQS